jgi:hypothetical protein
MGRKNFWPGTEKGYVAICCIPLLLCLSLLSAPAAEEKSMSYRQEMVEKAIHAKLYDTHYWHILLHYKEGLFGSKSLIDDDHFFLSPEGKSDPKAELEATIDAFFSGVGTGNNHPRCRFPARFEWLQERLSIDNAKLPETSCEDLSQHLSQMNPKSAVLVFASAHINSPASMFGHTLIRVDSSYDSPLLSYAVNYAARIDPRDNGMVYAFKGIFGFYPGYYSILAYYDKVKEYNNMDQRDLWEYKLNLTGKEVRRMVLHIWELKDIYSDYFFFDENCSYNLLFVLQAARPAATLTERKGFWVTPADTLFWVLGEGLSEEVLFRPSQARKIRHIASFTRSENIDLAQLLISGDIPPDKVLTEDLPEEEKINILDIASEYTQLRYMKKDLSKEEFQKKFLEILAARSKLRGPKSHLPPLPVPAKPEEGHATSRRGLGAGLRGDDYFLEASYRPVYHDLLDPDEGYKEGSQIDFSALSFRYYPEENRLNLQRWDAISIISLAERDRFFRPVSWKVLLGLTRKDFPTGQDRMVLSLNPGGGFAWKTGLLGLSYILFETDLDLSGRYPDSYALGFGFSAGVLKKISNFWKFQLQGRYLNFPLRDDHKEFSADFRQSFRLNRNNSLFFDVERRLSSWGHQTDFTLTWHTYF